MIDNVGDVFFRFSVYLNTYFAWSAFLGSAEAHIGWGKKRNGYLMASCVRNIGTKNY